MVPIGVALLYLLFGVFIGLILGVAIGKTYALIYLDDETNEKVEHIRQQRIDTEELRLHISRVKTLSDLNKLSIKLKAVQRSMDEEAANR